MREAIKQDHSSNNHLESTNSNDKGWRENVDKWSDKEAYQVMVVMLNIEDHESNSRDCIETQLCPNGKAEKNIIYLLHSRQVTTQKEGLIHSNLTFPFSVLSFTITKSINKILLELSSYESGSIPFFFIYKSSHKQTFPKTLKDECALSHELFHKKPNCLSIKRIPSRGVGSKIHSYVCETL